jgi:hypothetical protein
MDISVSIFWAAQNCLSIKLIKPRGTQEICFSRKIIASRWWSSSNSPTVSTTIASQFFSQAQGDTEQGINLLCEGMSQNSSESQNWWPHSQPECQSLLWTDLSKTTLKHSISAKLYLSISRDKAKRLLYSAHSYESQDSRRFAKFSESGMGIQIRFTNILIDISVGNN